MPLRGPREETLRIKKSTVFADLDRTKIEVARWPAKTSRFVTSRVQSTCSLRKSRGPHGSSSTGKLLRLNYIASNGMPYTPVGKFLIDRGIITKEEMSMDKIRDYMEANRKTVKPCAAKIVRSSFPGNTGAR